MYRFDLPCVRGTVVNTPALVEHVLKTNFECYEKGSIWKSRLQEILGNGIFNVDGSEWKLQRKTACHMFSARSLKETMSAVFARHGQTLMKKMEDVRGKEQYFDIVRKQ